MALTYIGEPGRFYATLSVDGKALAPVPGESYEISDPGDGRWSSGGTESTPAPVTADTTVVTADTTENAPEGTTEALEGTE